MELVKNIAIHVPLIIASLVFVAAAVLKAEKEKGAILLLSGAIGLCLLTIAQPIVYSGIVPKLIEHIDRDFEQIDRIFLVVNLIMNLAWAGAIILISIGTFLRPPPVRQP